MNILAIDPGYTTGICSAKCHDDFEVIQVGEFPWAKRHEALRTLLTGTYAPHGIPLTFDVVIIESFRLMPHKAQSQIGKTFPSSQLIGIVDYLCWKTSTSLVIQEPGQRTRVKVLDQHKDLVKGSAHKVEIGRAHV